MLYILWSVHIGIVCGCQLYEVAVLTSLIVTVVLLVLEHLNFGRKPYVLVLNAKGDAENEITGVLKSYTKSFRIKSRSCSGEETNFAIELSLNDPHALGEKLRTLNGVERFSIVQYDAEDVL